MSLAPYLDPDRGVFRNLLGITDPDRLRAAEAGLTFAALADFAEVNAIHPFREGNGRTQRAFFRQLSREAGWPIDWSDLEPDRNVTASIASLRGDNTLLHELLDSLVTR